MSSGRARDRLIETHRQLVAQAKDEIYHSLGELSPDVRRYMQEYESAVATNRGPMDSEELHSLLDGAHLVYFGDYHTLRESQKAPLRILREMLDRGREVIMATEAVHLSHQPLIDDYLAGDISEDELLSGVDYDRTWGFSWRNYRLQFEFARDNDLPLLGINSDPAIVKDSLRLRDSMAAMRLVEALEDFPDALIAVIFGDFHIAPPHLPAHVSQFLEARDLLDKRHVVVYQNAEAVYWDMAEKGLEQETHFVRIADDAVCLLNSTPLVMYQSYLNWELNRDELEESIGLEHGPSISSNVMTEQVLELVHTIARFLGFDPEGLDDFTVHTSRDLDLLDKLEATGDYTQLEIDEIRHQIDRDESYFVTRARLIYLGNLSIDSAAEESTHYINTKLAGHVENPPDSRFDFYYRVMKECIGFLGSRIINHKRTCYTHDDLQGIVDECRSKRLPENMKTVRAIARDALQHLDFESRWVTGQTRGYPRFRALYERDLEILLGTTHSLGYILGDRIYDALMAGTVRRNEVRQMFRERFEGDDRPREYYFDWVDYLAPK